MGLTRITSGVERGRRPYDLHSQSADRSCKGGVVGPRWRSSPRPCGNAEIQEEPFEAAGSRDRQDARTLRGDQVRVRNTAWKSNRLSRRQVVDVIADPDGDLPIENDKLLVLTPVQMQG